MVMRLLFRLLFVTLFVTPLAGQDTEFIRALDKAQEQRPATLTATARIAPESEPGTPLVIHGHAFAEDGKTPLANATIFAYHTDKEGVYDRPGTSAHSWRLRGWAKTGGDGRFEFTTIRPGAYPGRREPAHIHVGIQGPGIARFWTGGILFDDDPLVTEALRAESTRAGQFGEVRTVTMRDGVQHVDFNMRVTGESY